MALVLVAGGRHLAKGARTQPSRAGLGLSSLENALLAAYLSFRRSEIERLAGTAGPPIPFHVSPGETGATIGPRLQEKGLIRDVRLFRLLARHREVDDKLQAGEYLLRPDMDMNELLTALQHGRAPSTRLRVIEGWRAEQIGELLEERGIATLNEFMALVQRGEYSYDFLQGRPQRSLEGFLFPDTYELSPDATASQIIQDMLQNFDRRAPPAMRQRAQALGLTLHQVLTLASIVEREAALPQERPVIASVYLNRLRAGMHLDADPTVQYALGCDSQGNWWPKLRPEDMEIASPYNTYRHAGLPPGPISNPGLESIKAVLEPANTAYLYFVRNDLKGDGSHIFATTFQEHLANIQKYRRASSK